MKSFKINAVGDNNGPSIFGGRLKKGLESRKWLFDGINPDVNIVFASGDYIPGKINVLRLDNLYFDINNTIGDTDKLNSKIKAAYRRFDKIVFQSNFAVNQYRNHFYPASAPWKVIYNGVPKTFSPSGEKYKYPFERTLICSADWRAHKRLDAIIAGFKCFSDKDTGLVVLGNVKHKVNHKRIFYPGKVHHTDLPKYLRGADAGVHISWLDCSPNAVVEFIACGLPVLCSSEGGTKEIVKEDGIVLKVDPPYLFNKVDLYHPPEPDIDVVYWGMKQVLDWDKPVIRPDLLMKRVVDDYTKFIVG